jgi:1-acyl-sn-glycerol-3-phosphate acyltransferase
MRIIKGLYFWVVAFSVTIILFILLSIAHGISTLRGRGADGRAAHKFASIWGRLMINLMPGWSCEVEGSEHLPRDYQPMVIVANHESMSDIWAIYFLGIQFRWLSKNEVFRIPVIGPAMRWSNYVSVDRSSRQSGAEALVESSKRIKQGLSMFFFPEGTRSLDGVIKPFKNGAFKLARDENVPVLPIAMHGAGAMLPKHSWIPGRARIRIKILPPQPAPSPDSDLEAYGEAIRRQIISAHEILVAAAGTNS